MKKVDEILQGLNETLDSKYKLGKNADIINESLARNEDELGAAYCPCTVLKNIPDDKKREYICPCTDFALDSICKCKAFEKI